MCKGANSNTSITRLASFETSAKLNTRQTQSVILYLFYVKICHVPISQCILYSVCCIC